jgi:tyrosine-protein phosphatase YwqE
MIKIETHCHTIGTSKCADCENQTMIKAYKDAGYGGIVVTNHFDYNSYINCMEGQTHEQKVESFFNAIEDFFNECKKANLKCFWGVEVKTNSGVEYLVIGLDKNSFLKKPLFERLQKSKIFARYVFLSKRNGPGTFEGIYDENLNRIYKAF